MNTSSSERKVGLWVKSGGEFPIDCNRAGLACARYSIRNSICRGAKIHLTLQLLHWWPRSCHRFFFGLAATYSDLSPSFLLTWHILGLSEWFKNASSCLPRTFNGRQTSLSVLWTQRVVMMSGSVLYTFNRARHTLGTNNDFMLCVMSRIREKPRLFMHLVIVYWNWKHEAAIVMQIDSEFKRHSSSCFRLFIWRRRELRVWAAEGRLVIGLKTDRSREIVLKPANRSMCGLCRALHRSKDEFFTFSWRLVSACDVMAWALGNRLTWKRVSRWKLPGLLRMTLSLPLGQLCKHVTGLMS